MLLGEYQDLASRTDVSSSETSQRHLILGLFGEAGSVLSVVKKKGRDSSGSRVYLDSASEELGDLLWYVATAAKRSGLNLPKIAKPLALQEYRSKRLATLTFSNLQRPRHLVPAAPTRYLELVLMYLAEAVGLLIVEQRESRRSTDLKRLCDAYTKVLRRMIDVANRLGLSLDDVAKANLAKTSDRWPEDCSRRYPGPFDSRFPPYERLPRNISFNIREVESDGEDHFVYQSYGKIKIGDRLTDNIEYSDDYRFHDVFHYAYAAVIGWSPVLRSILKVKRKSVKEIDQNQDGARAILIEEGLATLIYNVAKREGGLFRDVERGKLSFDLLKTIRTFVQGYEVQNVPYWVWEEAILQGFEAFRYLVEHRRGRVTIDYANRRLEVGPIPLRALQKRR